jgi:hypothetical protein
MTTTYIAVRVDDENYGPAHAPAALIDCGSEGDRWADVVGGRHSVFENLS